MELIEIESKYDYDLEGVHFCIRALNLKDMRTHVSHLLVSRGFMYGTDGRRLHRYKLNRKVKPGLYRILKKVMHHIILIKTEYRVKDYPKTSHILNEKGKHLLEGACHKDLYVLAMSTIIRAIPEPKSINPDFLKDINEHSCDISIHREMISIETESKKAIIMFLKG